MPFSPKGKSHFSTLPYRSTVDRVSPRIRPSYFDVCLICSTGIPIHLENHNENIISKVLFVFLVLLNRSRNKTERNIWPENHEQVYTVSRFSRLIVFLVSEQNNMINGIVCNSSLNIVFCSVFITRVRRSLYCSSTYVNYSTFLYYIIIQ